VPVIVDDDAKAAAVGEQWFGAGRNVSNLLYLSIGTGVGAGLIVHDSLYRGTHELAGEIGHTTLDLNGPRCECGNRGCLETFVSTAAIFGKAQNLLGARVMDAGPEAALKELHRQAQAGVREAQLIKDETYQYLAAGVTNAVNFYDPDLIILGGLLPLCWPDLMDEMRRRVQGKSFAFASDAVTLVSSRLGTRSAMLGGASFVMQAVLAAPHLVRERTKPAAG
jgi:N-acetylglucosamine repressor